MWSAQFRAYRCDLTWSPLISCAPFKELRLERGRLGLGYIRACQTPKSGLPAGVLLAPQSLRLGGTIEMTPDKPCTGSFQVSE